MKKHTKKTFHNDQFGFILEIQGRFNIHKSVNVVCYVSRPKDRNQMIIRHRKDLWQKPTAIHDESNGESRM